MASIYRDSQRNGWRVQVVVRGVRRKLWLGAVTKSAAKDIGQHLDRLKHAAETATAPPADSMRWAIACSARIRGQLSQWGLVSIGSGAELPRNLHDYAQHYAQQLGGAASTQKRWANVRSHLKKQFHPGVNLVTVTPGDADTVSRALRSQFSSTHAGKLLGDFKQIFDSAVKHQLISSNPFDRIDTRGRHDTQRERYISPADAQKLLNAADPYHAALIALARFAGLRVPSEPLALQWSDIDWAGQKMTISSPKTGSRIIPLFPIVHKYLQPLFENPATDRRFVFHRARGSAATTWRDGLIATIHRASITPWPKLWQNLRASCRSDLEHDFPDFVINAWLGHSSRTAAKHYHRIHDGHFAQACGVTCGVTEADCGVTGGVPGPTSTDSTR